MVCGDVALRVFRINLPFQYFHDGTIIINNTSSSSSQSIALSGQHDGTYSTVAHTSLAQFISTGTLRSPGISLSNLCALPITSNVTCRQLYYV